MRKLFAIRCYMPPLPAPASGIKKDRLGAALGWGGLDHSPRMSGKLPFRKCRYSG